MRALPFLLLPFLPFAGCLEASEPGGLPQPSPRGLPAPTWSVGDWWSYHFTSEVYGEDFTATLVVGETGPNGTLVGMPVGEWRLGAILYHMPPLGRLNATLSYPVHDVPFEPFRFPLVDALAWTTAWAAAPVHLVALEANVTTPAGTFPGFAISNDAEKEADGRSFRFSYADEAGWFTDYERADLDGRTRERIELVGHGAGWNGTLRLLDGVTIVFLEARTQGLLWNGAPELPVEAFTPAATVDTVFAACVVGDAPGQYRVEVRAPSGTVCISEATITPDDVSRRIVAAEAPRGDGAWEARFAAAGQGLAIAEVIGYKSWQTELAPPAAKAPSS